MTTTCSKSPFAGHPDYDEESRNYVATPRPCPRVKPEAEENARRNRGSMEVLMSTDFNRSYYTPRPSARYGSLQGKENMERARGTTGKLLGGGYDAWAVPEYKCQSRVVKPEARSIAEQHKGGKMNLLLTNYGKNKTTPRNPPRVKWEAQSNYEQSRGSAMSFLLHNPQSMPKSARAAPRVKPEAEDIAMKNRGTMNHIMRVCTPRY